jgi:hypothetical protein
MDAPRRYLPLRNRVRCSPRHPPTTIAVVVIPHTNQLSSKTTKVAGEPVRADTARRRTNVTVPANEPMRKGRRQGQPPPRPFS